MKSAGPGRGTNSANLRLYNERTLLQRLRRAGEASKADLARWAQLTNTAVGSIVQSLEESRLIEQAGRRQEGQRGQPAGLYRINPEGAYGIGVRLDRTSIETVLIDLGGKILAREAHDMLLPQPDHALSLVRKDIARVLTALDGPQRRRLMGVGLAQPYNLGSLLRELDLKADFRVWDEVDFGQLLAQENLENEDLKAREGASRDWLYRTVERLPPHCGELLALWAYHTHGELFSQQMLRSFMIGQGTTEKARERAVPMFSRGMKDLIEAAPAQAEAET